MREILFRGKQLDNGEWVEGMPWIFEDKACICQWHEGMCSRDSGYFPVFVDTETVGQYIGTKDKYGVKIFEGDILERKKIYVDKIVICYKESAFCYYNANCEDYPVPIDDMEWGVVLELYEIIGNIFDNPELMESGDSDE